MTLRFCTLINVNFAHLTSPLARQTAHICVSICLLSQPTGADTLLATKCPHVTTVPSERSPNGFTLIINDHVVVLVTCEVVRACDPHTRYLLLYRRVPDCTSDVDFSPFVSAVTCHHCLALRNVVIHLVW